MRFRNVRNQEAGTAAPAVGGEEVRFRNVKMRQKRARPSAGRPKSEVVIWKCPNVKVKDSAEAMGDIAVVD